MGLPLRLLFVPLLACAAAWGLAWLGCWLARELALRRAVLDVPNDRSSHDSPVPRLGGLGVGPALIVVFLAYWAADLPLHELAGFVEGDKIPLNLALLFVGLVAGGLVVGLIDDLRPLHPLVKLAGQAVVASLPLWLGVGIPQITLPGIGQVAFAPPLAQALAAAWVLVLLNTINFIDGINGLAGRTLFWVGLGIILCGFNRPWSLELTWLGAILAGVSLGFHAWNATPARLFLGDGGSHAVGGALAGATLLLVNNDLRFEGTLLDHDSFLGPLLMLALPLYDVAFTLARRTLAGRSLLVPHREHLYQRLMIASGGSHEKALAACETVLFTGTLAGVYVVRFAHGSADFSADLSIAIVVVVAALGIFTARVRNAERVAAAPPA